MAQNEPYHLTWVTSSLAVGHAPMSYAQLDSLKRQGIDAILNLCGEFCDLHDIECRQGFEVHYMPLEDEEAPAMVELEKALAWLDESIYLGKKVLIHCKHGIGRTGTVLNAYLLRKGLGHKLAAKRLKKLKSKPANFDQWRLIRRYGKTSPKLTVREPSLEFKQAVDLSGYFAVYDRLVDKVEDLIMSSVGAVGRCGREHDRCSQTPITLSLVETARLTHGLNTELTSQERLDVIARAVDVSKKERQARSNVGRSDSSFCLSDSGMVCPLLLEEKCQVFPVRPMQCRSHELPEEIKEEAWDTLIAPELEGLSGELLQALVPGAGRETLPLFSLPDVVSGRYAESFFRFLLSTGAKTE